MNSLETFTRNAARRYLQNAVFVDDQIYNKVTGHPVEVSSSLTPFKSPFKTVAAKAAAPAQPEQDEPIP